MSPPVMSTNMFAWVLEATARGCTPVVKALEAQIKAKRVTRKKDFMVVVCVQIFFRYSNEKAENIGVKIVEVSLWIRRAREVFW